MVFKVDIQTSPKNPTQTGILPFSPNQTNIKPVIQILNLCLYIPQEFGNLNWICLFYKENTTLCYAVKKPVDAEAADPAGSSSTNLLKAMEMLNMKQLAPAEASAAAPRSPRESPALGGSCSQWAIAGAPHNKTALIKSCETAPVALWQQDINGNCSKKRNWNKSL